MNGQLEKGEQRSRQFMNKINATNISKLLILSFLIKKQSYGNELISKIQDSFNSAWKPSPGLIYPLLRDMEENLYIEGQWEEYDKKTKRLYKITDEGIKHYKFLQLQIVGLIKENIDMLQSILNSVN